MEKTPFHLIIEACLPKGVRIYDYDFEPTEEIVEVIYLKRGERYAYVLLCNSSKGLEVEMSSDPRRVTNLNDPDCLDRIRTRLGRMRMWAVQDLQKLEKKMVEERARK